MHQSACSSAKIAQTGGWLVVLLVLGIFAPGFVPVTSYQLPYVHHTEMVSVTFSANKSTISYRGALQKLTVNAFLGQSQNQTYLLLAHQLLNNVRLKSTKKANLSCFISAQPLFLPPRHPASDDNQPPLHFG